MNILNYLILILAMWSWCVLFFWLIQKPVFGFLNKKSCTAAITPQAISRVYLKGAVSDFIIASYLTAIPILTGLVHTLYPSFDLRWVLTPYSIIIGIAVGLISIGDTGLYAFWQSKIDASVFSYLRHPKGAFASVSYSYLTIAILSACIVAAIFSCGWILIISEAQRHTLLAPLPTWQLAAAPILCILLLGCGFLIIRGLKIRPNNPSVVYFSPIPVFNHWALNPIYNMIYSLGTRNEFKGRFVTFDDKECSDLFTPLFPTDGSPQTKLLNNDRPNILTIVWESFGGKFCGAIGGKADVTPEFNRLAEDGILFTNCRASSFRTDRALPAIFCGLPAQPTTSIIRYTRKLANLPAFPADLRDKGYDTVAVHGGDLTIMHKSDFYLSSGHTRIVAQKDLPKNLDEDKWGIHDAPVADWVYDEVMRLSEKGNPWLLSLQTLSSHEPFTVPYNRLPDPAENSMAYTDSAVGSLIDRLKQTPAWKNLLIVVVADHGLNLGEVSSIRDSFSHIPMLWTGGAVKRPMKINTIMSQTDLVATLLGQLGLPHSHYPFSRDILADTYTVPSSFHTYPNGFLFTDSSGFTDFDNDSGMALYGSADANRERRGKAILQTLFRYLDKL